MSEDEQKLRIFRYVTAYDERVCPFCAPLDGSTFDEDELKLLLVAVRHMRRTFAQARIAQPDAALDPYAALYDALFDKLRDMTGPLPETVEEALE